MIDPGTLNVISDNGTWRFAGEFYLTIEEGEMCSGALIYRSPREGGAYAETDDARANIAWWRLASMIHPENISIELCMTPERMDWLCHSISTRPDARVFLGIDVLTWGDSGHFSEPHIEAENKDEIFGVRTRIKSYEIEIIDPVPGVLADSISARDDLVEKKIREKVQEDPSERTNYGTALLAIAEAAAKYSTEIRTPISGCYNSLNNLIDRGFAVVDHLHFLRRISSEELTQNLVWHHIDDIFSFARDFRSFPYPDNEAITEIVVEYLQLPFRSNHMTRLLVDLLIAREIYGAAIRLLPIKWWMFRKVTNRVANVMDQMSACYLELRDYGPISCRNLIERLGKASDAGAVWPSSLHVLLDDAMSRGGVI